MAVNYRNWWPHVSGISGRMLPVYANETSLPDMLITFPAPPGGVELPVSTGDHIIPPCNSRIPGRSIFCVSPGRGFISCSVCGAALYYPFPVCASLGEYPLAKAPFLVMFWRTPCLFHLTLRGISPSEQPADQSLRPALF